MEKTLTTEKFFEAARAFYFNIQVNDYAVERVAFGFEKVGEKAPIDLYLEHLKLDIKNAPNGRKDVVGVYIDEQECISAEQDYGVYVRDLFVNQMERVFRDAPKDEDLENDCEEIPLQPRLREYLFGLLPLFTEILNVEVEYDVFDIIPTTKSRVTEYDKWKEFVTAVLLKPLKSGSRINKYVLDFTNAPYYVSRLIEKRGKNFYLKPIDIKSYEYIFALFSLMKFMNEEHGKILELKMFEWEKQHKSEE